MNPQNPTPELSRAIEPLKPEILRAIGFSTVISLLALAPTAYMLEVYERVVNSRSLMTLAMLTLMVVLAYGVMELLDVLLVCVWMRSYQPESMAQCFKDF